MATLTRASYCIEGSKEDLKKVFKAIDSFMTEKIKLQNDKAGKGWESNILAALGATEEQLSENISHGFIDTYELDENVLRIGATEMAVCYVGSFRDILGKLMPKLNIYYIVEKWEDHRYETNDRDGKYFPMRYLVHACMKGTTSHEYFRTEDEMKIFVSKLMGRKDVTIDEIGEWIEEHRNKDNFVEVIEIEYVM